MKRPKANPYAPTPARPAPDVAAEVEALRAAIREAHEAIQSLRVEKVEADREIGALMKLYQHAAELAQSNIRETVDNQVKALIDEWMSAARVANNQLQELMVDRFRAITRLWLQELIEGLMSVRNGRPLGFRTQIMGAEIDAALDRAATVLPHLVVTAWNGEPDATIAEVVEAVTGDGRSG